MNEKDSIKDLEAQARNTKHLMDRLNRAAYGMTFAQIGPMLGLPDSALQGLLAALDNL